MLNSAELLHCALASARYRSPAYLFRRAPDCQSWDGADMQHSGDISSGNWGLDSKISFTYKYEQLSTSDRRRRQEKKNTRTNAAHCCRSHNVKLLLLCRATQWRRKRAGKSTKMQWQFEINLPQGFREKGERLSFYTKDLIRAVKYYIIHLPLLLLPSLSYP